MNETNQRQPNQRRTFLKQVATGAAVLGTGVLAAPFQSIAAESPSAAISDADEWFKQVKGKHRIIFDVTAPNGSSPFAWPRVFLMTNAKTGTPENECGIVVVLRHSAIPYAMNHQLWEKYKFGELFKITDDLTKAPAVKNPFWEPKAGTFKIPGVGDVQIGINELQASGVLFCVCDMAITVHSAVVAKSTSQDEAMVKQEWLAAVLPGVLVAPSGIWAVGRAQEHGCAYCFAG
jgi:intracellular sulfur oxidation DsrE/DsrF family protein